MPSLVRMALLMDQSRSVLPLRSAKAREYGELWREKNVRAHLEPFHLNWPEPFLFSRPDQTNGKRSKKGINQKMADEMRRSKDILPPLVLGRTLFDPFSLSLDLKQGLPKAV